MDDETGYPYGLETSKWVFHHVAAPHATVPNAVSSMVEPRQGCKNGRECLHCHLCSSTEVRDPDRPTVDERESIGVSSNVLLPKRVAFGPKRQSIAALFRKQVRCGTERSKGLWQSASAFVHLQVRLCETWRFPVFFQPGTNLQPPTFPNGRIPPAAKGLSICSEPGSPVSVNTEQQLFCKDPSDPSPMEVS